MEIDEKREVTPVVQETQEEPKKLSFIKKNCKILSSFLQLIKKLIGR